ncbi:MAG TPA: prepilin-type N-terminal cleavage/methylation domain-containing protein [Sedimentisphaerales bacterium]|nr:prepilin-type N-terminal cleavage/methylation domain-containing protein [Sedimentisphaerales bacterium]
MVNGNYLLPRRVRRGLTLVELLVALIVSSIVLTAAATLAYAVGAANDATDDTARKQAQVRAATLRISELIRYSRMICAAPGNDLAIWRADDDKDGMIDPTELVYLEAGQLRDRLQLLQFSWTMSWDLTLGELADTNTKEALMLACTTTCIPLMPQCSNVQFSGLQDVVPQTRSVTVSFDLEENNVLNHYQINASLRCRAENLLNDTGDSIVSDDD